MPSKSVNITISTPIGDLKIYTDPREQKRAEELIKKTPGILTKGYERGTQKFAQQLLQIVARCFRSGMPPPGSGVSWSPLAASTIKKYGQHTIFNLTGQYRRSVGIIRQKNRIFVGLPRGIKKETYYGRTSKKTLNQIAIMLEYGSKDGNLPPRPMWKPAFKAAGGKQALKKSIINEVRKEIRKYK